MALYHFHVAQIGRAKGFSSVAAAAYRSGEELYDDYYGETHDYTKKGGVLYTEIMMPDYAPERFKNRGILWNEVEKIEKHPKAQLCYSFDIALQNELSFDENLELARQFVSEELVKKGMICDLAIHEPDKGDGGINNPHFHVICPIRPYTEDDEWGEKQRREYVLDDNGERVRNGSMYLMQFPQRTGEDRKPWICGGHIGLIWSMRSLRKKGWIAISIKDHMLTGALN